MTLTETNWTFSDAIAAPGRSPAIPEVSDVYGWLVGSWDLDVIRYGMDISGRGIKAEASFGWVLEGLAIQDVWSMHAGDLHMHGTTLRVWDASLGAWRITWIDPGNGRRDQMTGRWSGRDIVQVGTRADGTPIRWMFTEITPDSFRWTGEVLEADGRTWKLEGEFRARKRGNKS